MRTMKKNIFSRTLCVVVSALMVWLFVAPSTSYGDEEIKGPEAPAIQNEFVERDSVPYATHTVSFMSNNGQQQTYTIDTETGTIALPPIEETGFETPQDAVFVGWSTDKTGATNVYAPDVLFPDNASHTAMLDRDATLYAIWLPDGEAASGTTAYFYIRADGTIPFEPSQGAKSDYIPKASKTTLQGRLRQPVAITNRPKLVEDNIASVPDDDTISSVLAQDGLQYDPATQKIVWYVAKSRQYGGGAWNVDGVILPKSDYMVYYNPNGGDANVPSAKAYLEGADVSVDFSIQPTRPGYDFLGWATSATATSPDYEKGVPASFKMPDADKHLYAVWSPAYIDIDYIASPESGGVISTHFNTVRAYDGQGITGSIATPAKEYLFEGWYKDAVFITDDNEISTTSVVDTSNRKDGAFAATTYTARFVKAKASVDISKQVLNAPSNGEYYTEGESIEYKVEVSNTGNVALSNVSVDDTLAGKLSIGNIVAGETKSATYSYVVSAEDVVHGYVVNEAIVSGQWRDGAGNLYDLPEQMASAAIQTGALPPHETYVLYGVYPENSGEVGRNYEIVDIDTAAGLTEHTATAKDGYRFAGWYEDDEMVSEDPRLSIETMMNALNKHTEREYLPTLFIAYFVPDEGEGPDNPDEPNVPETPDTPDDPTPPDNPNDNGEGTDNGENDDESDANNNSSGSEGAEESGNASGNGNSNNASGYHSNGYKDYRSSTYRKTMPPTGDDILKVVLPVSIIALIAGVYVVMVRKQE